VTAGIDFALVVAGELFGESTAQAIQLAIEYNPAPPYTSGSPHEAPAEVTRQVKLASADALARRRAIIERITDGRSAL
jgi:cyclohexyl-isocyanide hydratase